MSIYIVRACIYEYILPVKKDACGLKKKRKNCSKFFCILCPGQFDPRNVNERGFLAMHSRVKGEDFVVSVP